MGPDGAAGVAAFGDVVRRRRRAAVEPLQASSVCGVVARQGQCVAEAGARGAASRGREQARRGVGVPARVVPLAAVSVLTHCRPFRRLSRDSVRPRADSGRRAGPKAGCG